MVLYHLCMSLEQAKLVQRHGFADGRIFRVADKPPRLRGRRSDQNQAIVVIAPSYEFSLDDYKLAYDATSTGERLVPGSVLNAFPRAIWPES